MWGPFKYTELTVIFIELVCDIIRLDESFTQWCTVNKKVMLVSGDTHISCSIKTIGPGMYAPHHHQPEMITQSRLVYTKF